MEKNVIWQSDRIQLIQIGWDEFFVNVVLVDNNVVKASRNWDVIVNFLNQIVK